MRFVFYHSEYGCETGCCGHYFTVYDAPKGSVFEKGKGGFEFSHPYAYPDAKEWAKDWIITEYGEEHCRDIDWENSLDIENVGEY